VPALLEDNLQSIIPTIRLRFMIYQMAP